MGCLRAAMISIMMVATNNSASIWGSSKTRRELLLPRLEGPVFIQCRIPCWSTRARITVIPRYLACSKHMDEVGHPGIVGNIGGYQLPVSSHHRYSSLTREISFPFSILRDSSGLIDVPVQEIPLFRDHLRFALAVRSSYRWRCGARSVRTPEG